VTVAKCLSVPVYAVYEGFVRLINSRGRPLRADLVAVLGGAVEDLDMDRVEIVERARIPSGHAGLTLGWTVFVDRSLSATSIADVALLAHELMHVRQCQRWGHWGMAKRYGTEWMRLLSYRDHPLEVEARRFEAMVVSRLR